ncbi:apolipoprotein D isoform 3-T3 [Amazona ochrocephala]
MSLREEKTPAEENAGLITGCDKGFWTCLGKTASCRGIYCFCWILACALLFVPPAVFGCIVLCFNKFLRSVGPGEQCWHLTFGEVEFASLDSCKKVAESNRWGTIRMTNSFLPSFPELKKNRDPSGFSLQGLRPWQQRQAGQGTFLRAQQNHCLSCHDRVCPLNVHFPPASRCSHAGHSSAALSPVQPPWLWEMPDVSHGTMPRPSSPRRLRYQPVFGQMVRDREAALKFRERKLHPGKLLIEGKWEVQGDQQGDASCLQPLIGSSPPTMKTTLWFTPAPTFSGSSTSTMPGFYQELPTCTQKLWST